MNRFSKLAGLGLLSSAVIFSAATYAQMDQDKHSDRQGCDKHHKWSGDGHDGLRKIKHAMDRLDLNETQQTQIDAIIADAEPTMKSMRKASKESRNELHQLMKSGQYDETAIKAAANKRADLMAQQIVFMAQTKAAIFKVLTDEQRETLAEKFAARKHHQ